MSFYRYALETEEHLIRSLVPLTREVTGLPYYTYRFYTSHQEDPHSLHVFSLGHEVSWPNKLSNSNHKQNNRLRLRYVVRGSALFNGTPVRAGQFFFSLPDENYRLEVGKNPFEYYYISVSGAGIDDIVKTAGFTNLPRILNCPFIGRIPNLLDPILMNPDPQMDPEYHLIAIFLDLISLHRVCYEASSHTAENASYTYYVKAINFIREYLAEGITPGDIATFLHLSPSYLRAIFSKHCKYSLREYLMRKRIERAASLLTERNFSVGDAASAVGYEDFALFSKMFKRYTGYSPRQYKDRYALTQKQKAESRFPPPEI